MADGDDTPVGEPNYVDESGQSVDVEWVDEPCPNESCSATRHMVVAQRVANCPRCGKTWEVGEGLNPIEAVRPDEVIPAGEHGTEVEVADPRNEAIIAAANEAMIVPGVPGRDEFLALAAQARILSMSGGAPKQIRGNPYLAFHVALLGRDMEISPSAALQMIDAIGTGEDVQLSISPELKVARIKRKGLGSVELLDEPTLDPPQATAIALRPGGFIERDMNGKATAIHGEIGRATFTWEDAVIAGLVDPRCEKPTGHWRRQGGGNSREDRCRCRQGWRTYPKRMLGWRAKGYCADDNFAEAGLGLYSPEELGATVDENGRAIDPSSVDLPDGYEVATGGSPAAADPAMDDEAKAALKARITALPPEQRTHLADLWGQKVGEKRIHTLDYLTEKEGRFAEAMVASAEADARKTGWAPAAAPQEPTEGESPPGAEDGPTDEQGPESGDPEPAPQPPSTPPPAAATADTSEEDETEAADQALLDEVSHGVSIMTARVVTSMLRERGAAVADNVGDNRRVLASLLFSERDEERRRQALQGTLLGGGE